MRKVLMLVMLMPAVAMAADAIQPGLYETQVVTQMKMGEMEMPGRTSTQSTCITAEDVANGPPLAKPDDANCQVLQYEFGDGKLAMELTCSMQGGEGRMVGSGTYTQDSYEMTNEFKMKAQGMEMQMTSKAKGRRLRDC